MFLSGVHKETGLEFANEAAVATLAVGMSTLCKVVSAVLNFPWALLDLKAFLGSSLPDQLSVL